MKTAWDLLIEYINGKAKTRIYSLFLTLMIIMHGNVIFSAIFIDQNLIYKKYGILKNEYIAKYVFNMSEPTFWINEAVKLSIAIILTYLIIWVFPNLITKHAYDRELTDEFDLRFKKISKENELADKKSSLAKKELEIVKAENETVVQQFKIEKTEEQKWDEDYETFEKSPMYTDFKTIIESVFEHYGRLIQTHYDGSVAFSVDTDTLAYANSNDLVDFDQSKGSISLTPKGKYFVKKYQISS